LGAGLVFGPLGAGVVGLVGACDIRELRRDLSISRALFNRAQVSLSGVAGATVFVSLGGELGNGPTTVMFGLLALAADSLINYLLVGLSTSITQHRGLLDVFGDMHVGAREGFLVAYVSFGCLALVVAEAYSRVGVGGLLIFGVPLLLARQLFLHRYRLAESDSRLRQGQLALRKLQTSIAHERRDERMVLAGELHDEVLPPLFKVHLMGQVLRQDLDNGRLLDLDEDLPELLGATEAAQVAVRELVRNLRRSSLGPGGLAPTLAMAAKQVEAAGSPRIALALGDVGLSHSTQLVLYQVAKEAMVNAAKYARASLIEVRLEPLDDGARLLVKDDGVGFDLSSVDKDNHFGLQFMVDRVEAIGGEVVVDSRLGVGTTVSVTVPKNEGMPSGREAS
jgi:signal transduction histidine kinase